MKIMPRNTEKFNSEQFEQDLLADTGLEYKKSFKTTQDIATELDDMGGVSIEAINQYLQEHGYYLATQPDGTVAWVIWERVVRPDSLV